MDIPTSVVSILNKYYYITDNNLLFDKLNSEYSNNNIQLNDFIDYKNIYNKQKTLINIDTFKLR